MHEHTHTPVSTQTCCLCSAPCSRPSTWKSFLPTPMEGIPERTPRWLARPNPAQRVVMSTTAQTPLYYTYTVAGLDWTVLTTDWRCCLEHSNAHYWLYVCEHRNISHHLPLGWRTPLPSTRMTCKEQTHNVGNVLSRCQSKLLISGYNCIL